MLSLAAVAASHKQVSLSQADSRMMTFSDAFVSGPAKHEWNQLNILAWHANPYDVDISSQACWISKQRELLTRFLWLKIYAM
jgi:hypothetical protein